MENPSWTIEENAAGELVGRLDKGASKEDREEMRHELKRRQDNAPCIEYLEGGGLRISEEPKKPGTKQKPRTQRAPTIPAREGLRVMESAAASRLDGPVPEWIAAAFAVAIVAHPEREIPGPAEEVPERVDLGFRFLPLDRETGKPAGFFDVKHATSDRGMLLAIGQNPDYENAAIGIMLKGGGYAPHDKLHIDPENGGRPPVVRYLNQDELAAQERRSRFRAVPTFDEFMWADHPEPKSLVGDGLIRAGDFVLLSGAAYSGKSYSTMDLAIAIAAGKPWYGFETTKGRVGIVPREIGAGDLQLRFKTLIERADVDEGGLAIFPAVHPYITGPVDIMEDADGLIDFCKRYQLDLLLLDPLSRLHMKDESNSYSFQPVMAAVDHLREECGVTVLIVHHDRKSGMGTDKDLDAPRGTTLLSTNPTVSIRQVELSGKIRRLSFHLNHREAPEPVFLKPAEGGGFETTDAPIRGKAAGGVNREKILKCIQDNDGTVDYKMLFDADVGSDKTIRRHVEELLKKGLIKKKKTGNKVWIQSTTEDE